MRAPEVPSDVDEPAVTGDDPVVPRVDDWQRAADGGVTVRARSGSADVSRPGGPPWVPASARMPRAIRDALIDWLRAALPNEGWGILVSDRLPADGGTPSRFVGMRNAAESPYRYYPDPDELLAVMLKIDDDDEQVWAVVHSHVASPPYPSPTDIGLAAYPDALYVLASFASEPPEVRAWTIVEGAVNEVVLERG